LSLDQLLARVTTRLAERGIEHRLIGAAALAAHGVPRSTYDVDLLATDPAVLDSALWVGVAPPGFTVEVRHGDEDDPLLGVVRIEEDVGDEVDWEHLLESLDIVVVRGRWAARMTSSPGPEMRVGSATVRAVDAIDLVLLKLYAGGRRDGWDIETLLESRPDPADLVAAVDARIDELPKRCARLWRRIRDERRDERIFDETD
jgi:hypothetical protein